MRDERGGRDGKLSVWGDGIGDCERKKSAKTALIFFLAKVLAPRRASASYSHMQSEARGEGRAGLFTRRQGEQEQQTL
jgi:hypothetical protein